MWLFFGLIAMKCELTPTHFLCFVFLFSIGNDLQLSESGSDSDD